MAKKINYTFTVGRRKKSTARVRLFKGRKENLVNDQPIESFFDGPMSGIVWKKPFRLTDTLGKYYATVVVKGGGKTGQLEAVAHGIAKALAKYDSERFRPVLKRSGLLTRDARVKERRKVGTGGKARRKKQSPKR